MKVHRLKKTIVVRTNNGLNVGVLPKDTLMYYEKSLSEGIDRYKIYLNVEKMDLDLDNNFPEDLKDPLISFMDTLHDSEDFNLRSFLKTLGLKKSDLKQVIDNWEVD